MNELPPVVVSEEVAIPAEISLSATAQQYLDQTRPWVIFFAVMVFVAAGFMFLGGLGAAALGLLGGMAGPGERSIIGPIMQGMFYGAMAVFYIPAGILLCRYAGAIKLLRTDRSAAVLEHALRNERAFWRYCGILTAIAIVLTILIVIAAILFAAFLSAGR